MILSNSLCQHMPCLTSWFFRSCASFPLAFNTFCGKFIQKHLLFCSVSDVFQETKEMYFSFFVWTPLSYSPPPPSYNFFLFVVDFFPPRICFLINFIILFGCIARMSSVISENKISRISYLNYGPHLNYATESLFGTAFSIRVSMF